MNSRFFAPSRLRVFFLLLASCFLLLSTGCAPSKSEQRAWHGVRAYYAGDYERAVDKLDKLAEKRNKDFVLNNCRLGSAELAAYHFDAAEAAFLRAYEVINSVGVNDGGRSLGAVLVDEKVRVWKGEPFERAMCNYYLGLIYYMRQDYNNARAAFENALFKLRENTDEKARESDYARQESNFILGIVMLGKTWQRLGRDDLAQANFERARQLRRDFDALTDERLNGESNVLLVIDYGYGPRKDTKFDGSIIGFTPTPDEAGHIPQPVVTVNGNRLSLDGFDTPTIDLLAMAQDRRWQSIDTLRAFKSAVGTGLILAGAYEAGRGIHRDSNQDLGVAAILIGSGLLLKATSQADVRQWEMLPRTTFLIPLKLPPGTHDVAVEFPQVFGTRQEWKGIEAPSHGEATYYIRMQGSVRAGW